jgi:hypothetical protein
VSRPVLHDAAVGAAGAGIAEKSADVEGVDTAQACTKLDAIGNTTKVSSGHQLARQAGLGHGRSAIAGNRNSAGDEQWP